MSSSIKMLRGQLRQIVKELLPELLQDVLYVEVERKVNLRLDAITKHLKSTLDQIDTRHKDTMSYLIRSTAQVENTKKEPVSE